MLSSIEQFLNALDANKILYCHWKSNEHLRQALEGDTDLDLLFDPAQCTTLARVFAECGIKRFRATPLMQYNGIEDYIGFDQEKAKIWHVHTHYRMTLGEKHLKGYTVNPWGALLLQDRICGENNVWIAAPSDEYVLLLSRISLKLRWRDYLRCLGADDKRELCWLRERTDRHEIEAAASRLLQTKSAWIVSGMYETELVRKAQFLHLQKALRKELRPYTGYNRFTSWFARTCREAFWLYGGVRRRLGLDSFRPYRRILPAGGLVVAFLGCDGAGKSSTLSYVKKEFSKKIDVAALYFGSGDGSSSLLRRPMKAVARRIGGKGLGHAVDKEYAAKGNISFRSRMYSVAKVIWALALAKEKEAKQKQMKYARNHGMLVLTDRYPQSIVPGICDGPLLHRYKNTHGLLGRLAKWEETVYQSFAENTPDLAIKLIVPTEIAIQRKPEMTTEEIETKKKIVMDMDIAPYMKLIDTSRPFEITRGEVMRAIWDLI